MSMSDEVMTPCPACGETIPFYRTVDVERACPECDTPRTELFAIAEAADAEADGDDAQEPEEVLADV